MPFDIQGVGSFGRRGVGFNARHVVMLLFVSTGLMLMLRAEPAEAQAKLQFHIEAREATQSLTLYASQARVQIGFDADAVRGIRTNAVKGEYSTRHALDLMLAGTGLEAVYGENAIVVRPIASADRPPVHAAEESAVALRWQPPASASAGPASSPRGPETPDRTPRRPKTLEEIIVTGSNIRGSGSVGASAILFERQELERSGFSTVEELFQNLPQNLDEITPIGGFSTGASNLAGFNTQGVSGVNLRGLGPGSTLVLLNGKRRPGNLNGRAVDVSAIPLAMVERIELVSGGYSAIYGSDAVAGVVNIITRTAYDGAETELYYGDSSAGGQRFNLNQTVGIERAKGGFVLGYDYRDAEPLDAAATGVVQNPSPSGFAPIPGLFHIRGDSRQHAVLAAGHLQLSDGLEVYADAHFAYDDYTNQLGYRIDSCCDIDIHIANEAKQYSAVTGARFDLSENWSVDVSALTGLVDNTLMSGSSVVVPPGTISSSDPRPEPTIRENDEAELNSLSLVADGPWRLFGRTSLSTAVGFDYRNERYTRSEAPVATGQVETVQDRDRDVWSLFGEAQLPLLKGDGMKVALSLAGRYDHYSDFGGTFNPQIGLKWDLFDGLVVRAAFSKAFRAPELFELSRENRVRVATLVDPLDATGQTTATVFIDTGGNASLRPEEADTHTIGLDWWPSEHVKLSLSYFRLNYDGRIDTPDSFSGGFAALENESQYPGLIDRNPTSERLDEILGRAALVINNSGIPFDPSVDDPFDVFTHIIIFDNRTNNISLERLEAIDLLASADWVTGLGELSLGLNGTYYLDSERNITAVAPAIVQINEPGRPVDLRFRAHAGWAFSSWNAQLYVNYVDSYRDTTVTPTGRVESWTTVDLTVGWEATDRPETSALNGLQVTLGVNNLLDERPPELTDSLLGLGYDAINASAQGRYVSLRIAKGW